MIRLILKSFLVSVLIIVIAYLVAWVGRLVKPEIEPLWSRVRDGARGYREDG